MTTLASLQTQVKVLRSRIPLPDDPHEFCLDLDQDEDIPAAVRAMIRPFDMVMIRYYPAGYLGLSESDMSYVSIGYVLTLAGQITLLYRDGRKERIYGAYQHRANRR